MNDENKIITFNDNDEEEGGSGLLSNIQKKNFTHKKNTKRSWSENLNT